MLYFLVESIDLKYFKSMVESDKKARFIGIALATLGGATEIGSFLFPSFDEGM